MLNINLKALRILTIIAGISACLLGFIVMFGWFTHNLALIQVSPHLVPMQFNTCIGFIFAGISFIAVVFQFTRLARIVSLTVFVIGSMTLFQYLFDIDLGIDQFFFKSYVFTQTSQPGRMAPNTALCFSIIGASLYFMASPIRRKWMPILAGVTGAVLLGLSLVALTGYWLNIEAAFGWGVFTRMAVHTAVGFGLLAIGYIALATHQGLISKDDLINYLPAPMAMIVLTVTLLLWHALNASLDGNRDIQNTLLNMVLVFGGLLAGALTWALNRAHAVKVEAHATKLARVALENDIFERKLTEDALRESEERFRSIFENAAVGIALIEISGKYLQVNPAFCKIVGYTSSEVISEGMTFQEITHPDDLELDLGLTKSLLNSEDKSYKIEKRYIRKDGEIAWVHLSVFLLRDAQNHPQYFISACQDITTQKMLQLEIEHQARVDYLTGLHNRRYFMEEGEVELARAVRYKKPLSVMMLDIDFFKRINDTYGHKTGDIVLQNISKICTDTLREVDIIGRLGGEEFAVLLPETKLETAMDVAERLRSIVEQNEIPLENGLPLHITVSIGVATLKRRDSNIDTLLHKADEALYEAKKNGRNKVCI